MTQETEARTTGLFSYTTIQNLGKSLLDLIFPPECIHCGRVDVGFCDVCLAELRDTSIHQISQDTSTGLMVVSTGDHSGVLQSAVQALKYHNQRELAQPLARRLAQLLLTLDWTFDIIIPVPMHTSRLRERGYNQAQEIAVALAQQMNSSCVPTAIQRIRATQSQVGLNRQERMTNLDDAFVANADMVAGKRILLVDDVQTTGTTLSTCATVALEAGADHIYGITVTAARLSNN